jgi:hypothetical protein
MPASLTHRFTTGSCAARRAVTAGDPDATEGSTPPASLLTEIEQARAELDKCEAERKAAWSCEGHALFSHLLVCHGYHGRFQLWVAARDKLRALERRQEGIADAR